MICIIETGIPYKKVSRFLAADKEKMASLFLCFFLLTIDKPVLY